MWFPESQVRIWLYAKPTDMRKSFDGLIALVKQQLREDPLSGAMYVFVNRRQNQLRVLYFDRSGYCLWSKRLEQGRFRYRAEHGEKQRLDWTRLKLLIEGIEEREVRRFKRYRHPEFDRPAV